MASTPNLNMTLLEVGQREKEVTINTALSTLDSRVPVFLGQLSSAPSVSGSTALGSSYFNTTTNRMNFLVSVSPVTWRVG